MQCIYRHRLHGHIGTGATFSLLAFERIQAVTGSEALQHVSPTRFTAATLVHTTSLASAPLLVDGNSSLSHNAATMLTRNVTAAPTAKAAPALFDQLEKSLKGPEGAELIRKVKVRAATTGICSPLFGATTCLDVLYLLGYVTFVG